MIDTSHFHKNSFRDYVDPYLIESPIESELYRVISKYLDQEVELRNQFPMGMYRLDFMVAMRGYRVGIECDGKHFHKADRDEMRDERILRMDDIHSIVRLRGTDIVYRLPDALAVLAHWYPWLFSERGIDNIRQLMTLTSIDAQGISESWAHIRYPFDPEDDDHGLGEMYVTRKIRRLGK